MFQRLQTRLTILYATLFGAVLITVCGLLWIGQLTQSRLTVETNLQAAGGVFDRIWQERADRVRGGAEVLARDFGFRSALASRDAPTIQSAVDNLRARLRLDVAFAVDPNGQPLTGAGSALTGSVGAALARSGDAQGVVFAGSQPYEIVSAPIYAPQLQGWIVFGSRLGPAQMSSLAGLSSIPLAAQVVRDGGGPGLHFPQGLGAPGWMNGPRGREFAVIRPLPTPDGAPHAALLLHYPQAEALAPYRALLWTVTGVALLGLLMVAIGSWILARSITRPIAALAAAAGRMREGEVVHVEAVGGGEVGELAGGFNAMVDAVAEREQQIRRSLVTDADTGLPNRQGLEETVARAECDGAPGVLVVAAFGVGQFARMKGVLGFELAAELVRGLGQRLAAVQPGWAIARTATDTLSACFRAPDLEVAADLVEAARQVLEAAIPVGGHLIDMRVTTGLGFGLASHITRDAELALDAARQQGVRFARFDPAARSRAAESLGLMPELRRAIAGDALSLAHQPKWDVRGQTVTSVESLIRWTHPQRGAIRPDVFIGLAEDTGDIRALTDWVVTRALEEQARLAAGGRRIAFSLNLSGRLVGDAHYTRWLLDTVAAAKGPICMEITETAVIGDPQAALATFAAFAEAGVGVSIDDYGSGLSSLAYLKQIAATELKLDRSLIVDVGRSARDALLIRSTVDLAHGLGMKVVAEGVEDATTMALLSGMGCDLIQGWHVARPMPLSKLMEYLGKAARPDIAAGGRGQALRG